MTKKQLVELSKVCRITVGKTKITIISDPEFGPVQFSDYRTIIKMRTGNEVGDVVTFGSDGVTFWRKF